MVVGCISNKNTFSYKIDPVEDAKKVFFDYYGYLKNANYIAASNYILKNDLDEYKEFFFPLFVNMKESYSGKSPYWDNMILFDENDEEVSSEVFLANCLEISMEIHSDLQYFLKNTEIEIINWHQENNYKTIIFEYKTTNLLRKKETIGTNTLIFQDGRWYIKFKMTQLITQFSTINIPEWVNYDLSINEMKRLLGIFELGDLEYGIGSELGFGLLVQMDKNYCYFPYYELMQFMGNKISKEEAVGYLFSFDSQGKLETFSFFGNHNYQNVLTDFTNKYGMPTKLNWEGFYAVHLFNKNLPSNIASITTTQETQKNENRIVIFYKLK
jgi:hypothetical protein